MVGAGVFKVVEAVVESSGLVGARIGARLTNVDTYTCAC